MGSTTNMSPQLFVDALQYYAYSGDVVCLLAPQSSLLSAPNKDGDTPLHTAVSNYNTQAVSAFARLMNVSGLDTPNSDMDTALHLAVRTNQIGVVDLLTGFGADISTQNNMGNTPLHLANSDLMVHALLSRSNPELVNKALDTPDYNGNTPLLKMINSGNLRTIESLVIDFGANVNTSNTDSGRSALHICARFDSFRVANLLLEFGAQTDAVDTHGATPLISAMQYDAVKVARILIDYGADVTAANSYEVTVLETAHNYQSSRALSELFAVPSITVPQCKYLRTGEVMLALKSMSISNPDINLRDAHQSTQATAECSTQLQTTRRPLIPVNAPTEKMVLLSKKNSSQAAKERSVPPAYTPVKLTKAPQPTAGAVDFEDADPEWQVLDRDELKSENQEAWQLGQTRSKRLAPGNILRNLREKKDKQKKKSTSSGESNSSATEEKRRLAEKYGSGETATLHVSASNPHDEKRKMQQKYDLVVEGKEGSNAKGSTAAANKAAEARLEAQKMKVVTSLD
ncbi:hypothetical protein SARC_02862 [Sphaeroforma arctica JP610]|uniref:Uncharacterized protein n=1 Tax=Sphaeroforma arctica JP610 TaxID=667725 RepID=A0A0L0G7G0_9EUKA|nr:hypothetical protein SARC_02862 [Sphaeroforma arctica JP610]KNC84940.1 hypothetical protein SARC_02862 [Sphaeroforma arctica JP610]|eukprot:XP_014158842.1 hypothetical protein SARC_02862 [Sphaeroforma arctica JP610]